MILPIEVNLLYNKSTLTVYLDSFTSSVLSNEYFFRIRFELDKASDYHLSKKIENDLKCSIRVTLSSSWNVEIVSKMRLDEAIRWITSISPRKSLMARPISFVCWNLNWTFDAWRITVLDWCRNAWTENRWMKHQLVRQLGMFLCGEDYHYLMLIHSIIMFIINNVISTLLKI